jgi:hypothetical protein
MRRLSTPACRVAALAVLCLGALVARVELSPAPAAASESNTVACQALVQWGSLPVWARGGFHPPTMRIPHVLGASGDIVAVLFGYPLLSPPSHSRNNKILWVSRVKTVPTNLSSSLRIKAQRMKGSRPVGSAVSRTVAHGPGPSIINLPAAGCWRFTLRWSGRVDTLDLRYRRGG